MIISDQLVRIRETIKDDSKGRNLMVQWATLMSSLRIFLCTIWSAYVDNNNRQADALSKV